MYYNITGNRFVQMLLHSIFYNEYMPVSIDALHPFMYTSDSKTKTDCVEIFNPPEVSIIDKIQEKCISASKVQDGLFWSVYIAKYGYDEYLRNKYNYGKLEIQEKQNIAQYVLEKGIGLKTNYRLTRMMCNEIVSDLTNLPRMTYSGLIAMCAYYQTDIILVDLIKNTYLSFLCLEDNRPVGDTIVIYKNPLYTKKHNSNEYFVDVDLQVQSISELKDRYFGQDHYLKPLRGISTYLKPDLEQIALKTVFKAEPEKAEPSYSKKELYTQILIYLSEN